MHTHLIFILLLLTITSQASILTMTIEADAAEISCLNEALKSHSPAVVLKSQSLVCEMINSCCPFIKPRLAEYMDGSLLGLNSALNACFGGRLSEISLDACPMMSKFIDLVQDNDFLKYANVLALAGMEAPKPSINLRRPCSSDEIYATLCEWTKQNQIISCEQKTLRHVAEQNSDQDYRTFVQQTKYNLRFLINATKNAFPTENNNRTTLCFPNQTPKMSSASIKTKTSIFLSILLYFLFFY